MVRFSPAWFAIGFGVFYPLCLAFDWHLFLYYPLTGEWSIQNLPDDSGPAMQWYGLMASSALPALGLAWVMPSGTQGHALSRVAIFVCILSMLACAFLLRSFFQ